MVVMNTENMARRDTDHSREQSTPSSKYRTIHWHNNPIAALHALLAACAFAITRKSTTLPAGGQHTTKLLYVMPVCLQRLQLAASTEG
jgi:hypothetical protein